MASDQTGDITGFAYTGGRVLFFMSGARSARSGCDCCNRWEIVVSNANEQALILLLMTVQAHNRTVDVSGSGPCVSGSNDTEGVGYVQTN